MMNVSTKSQLFLFILCFAALKVNAQPLGGIVTPTAVQVCPGAPNSGLLSLIAYAGTIFTWQDSISGGGWTNTGHEIPNDQSYSNIKQTTCYRVIVQDSTGASDTSTTACITIYPPSVGGTISGGGAFCDSSGSDTLFLTGYIKNVLKWQYSTDGGSNWNTVANTTDTLIHPNITQNTVYRVIVENIAGCPTDTLSQAFFIIDTPTIAGTISGSDTMCYGVNDDSLILSGNVGNVLYWLSSTDGGSTWNTLPNTTLVQTYSGLTQTTRYAATVQNGVCDADTTSFAVITVLVPAPVSAGNDTTIIQGQSTTLNGIGNGTPFWSPSTGLNNDTLFMPTATPTVTINYVLAVTDTNGCVNTDTVIVTVTIEECNGTISNLFTPNGDEINDTWYIQGIQNCPDNEVFLYNIYGNEVYHKKGYANDWKGTYNGSELPDGTYYYVFKINDSSRVFKGSVDIVRSK